MSITERAQGAPGQKFLGRRVATGTTPAQLANANPFPVVGLTTGVRLLVAGKRGQTFIVDKVSINGMPGSPALDAQVATSVSALNGAFILMASTKDNASADLVRHLLPFYLGGTTLSTGNTAATIALEGPQIDLMIDKLGFVPPKVRVAAGDRGVPPSLGVCRVDGATGYDSVTQDVEVGARFVSEEAAERFGIRPGWWGHLHSSEADAVPGTAKILIPAPTANEPTTGQPIGGVATDYWRIHTLIVLAGPPQVTGGTNTITIGTGATPATAPILSLRAARADDSGFIKVILTDVDLPCPAGAEIRVAHAGFGTASPLVAPDTRISVIVGAELCPSGVGRFINKTGVPT